MSVRIAKTIAAALAVALLTPLAACGTTDDAEDASSPASGNGSSTSQGYDTSSIAKDDALAALLPESVTKDGVLTVGADTSTPPAEFHAADGKTPVGFSVDLSKAMAALFGLKERTVSSTFDSIIPSVGPKYDLGISSFTITKDRLEAVDFVSYFKAGSTYVVSKGNPKHLKADALCGVKAAVQTGTTQESELEKASAECKAAGKQEIDIQSSKLLTDVTTAVASGKVDIIYTDSPVAGYAVKQTDGALEALGEDVGVAPYGIVVKKGDDATAEAVSKAMQKLIDDGTYAKILDYWGVKSGAIDKAEIDPTGE